MNVFRARWWQASLAGLVAGVVFAGGRILALENKQIGGEEFVSLDFFEQMLHLRTPDGEPFVKDITICNRGDIDLLSFEAYDELTRIYTARWLAVPHPYTPAGTQPALRSIEDYLLALKPTIPDIIVRRAWWSEPPTMFLICAAGGALAGSLLPLVPWLLVPPAPKFQAPRSATNFTEKPRLGAESGITAVDRRHLEELEAEMVAGLRSGTAEALQASEPSASGAPKAAATCALNNEEKFIRQPTDSAENTEYVGEYYPVVKNARQGFTLGEVIVAIGITVLLAAVLLPVLSRVQEQASQSQCASNLRQIGAARELYDRTYHSLPLSATAAGMNDAMNEVKIVGLMTCPNDAVGELSYAMNAAYVGLPKAQGNPTELLAFETGIAHKGRFNVVYFDGHVDDLPRGAP